MSDAAYAPALSCLAIKYCDFEWKYAYQYSNVDARERHSAFKFYMYICGYFYAFTYDTTHSRMVFLLYELYYLNAEDVDIDTPFVRFVRRLIRGSHFQSILLSPTDVDIKIHTYITQYFESWANELMLPPTSKRISEKAFRIAWNVTSEWEKRWPHVADDPHFRQWHASNGTRCIVSVTEYYYEFFFRNNHQVQWDIDNAFRAFCLGFFAGPGVMYRTLLNTDYVFKDKFFIFVATQFSMLAADTGAMKISDAGVTMACNMAIP